MHKILPYKKHSYLEPDVHPCDVLQERLRHRLHVFLNNLVESVSTTDIGSRQALWPIPRVGRFQSNVIHRRRNN